MMSLLSFILIIISATASIAFLLERKQRLAAEAELRQVKAGTVAPQARSAPNNPALELCAAADILGLGPVLDMQYRNAEGEFSQRRIWLLEVEDGAEDGLIVAHCERAQARRTFRIDRILTLTDTSTGRPIRNPASYFAQYMEPPEPIPEGHASVMTRSRPGRMVLTWIARANGAENANDINILLEYITERSRLGGRPAVNFNHDLAREALAEARIRFEDAEQCLARIRRGGAERQLVLRFANRIAEADPSGAREKRRARLFR